MPGFLGQRLLAAPSFSWQNSWWPLHCWKGMSAFNFVYFSTRYGPPSLGFLPAQLAPPSGRGFLFFLLKYTLPEVLLGCSLRWGWPEPAACPLTEVSCSSPEVYLHGNSASSLNLWAFILFFKGQSEVFCHWCVTLCRTALVPIGVGKFGVLPRVACPRLQVMLE